MSIAALVSILKYFGPMWFKAIMEEAKQTPATIAGLFFVWITIGIVSVFMYNRLAQAEDTMVSMQEILAANTKALDCSGRDRRISAKAREILVNARLLERATDAAERRDLEEQIDRLTTDLNRMEIAYEHRCLNGGL